MPKEVVFNDKSNNQSYYEEESYYEEDEENPPLSLRNKEEKENIKYFYGSQGSG